MRLAFYRIKEGVNGKQLGIKTAVNRTAWRRVGSREVQQRADLDDATSQRLHRTRLLHYTYPCKDRTVV